jgi:serine/threonine-protein kinase
LIGTFLDNRYEVLQKVGEGGMATVYRGRHNTLNRYVAIKVLHPHLSSSTRNRKRFAREARAIEHLHHDNILQIFDYSGLGTTECYIITEFVEGHTLSSVLTDRGQLPSEVAALIGLHLARALAYAHSEGILHRDLKPDNVMIRADGTVKLMDFGIARFLNESQVTMTGALVGSPAFMSPEQAKEEPLDLRSDLFSLGTVLFQLVTGYLPFTGSNPSLILKNVIEGTRPHVTELAPAMSADFADVIERLMGSSPEDRYDSAVSVAAALEQCLDEVGVLGDPTFALGTYIENPDAFDRRIEDHLCEALLARGKVLLGRGDHLAALRLLNRLLSLDEDNEEVLALVQGLHTLEAPSRGRGWLILAALLALALLAGGGWIVFANWDELGQREGPEVGASAVPSSPEVMVEPVTATSPQPGPAPMPSVEPPPVVSPAPLAAPVQREPELRADRRVPRFVAGARPAPRLPAAPSGEVGRVKITSSEMPADIWLGDRKIGATRTADPIQLPVGTHELTVKSNFAVPQTIKITIGPGELIEKEVHLQPKPAVVVFDQSYPGVCDVFVDGRRAGLVRDFAEGLEVPKPDMEHVILVECPSGQSRSETYAFVRPRTAFPPLD